MKESPGSYINPFLSDEENEKFEKSLEPSKVPSESLEKAEEVYVDKNVTEFQLPEMITCYEENGLNVVKDICVDEGVSHGEIIKCKEHHELSCNPIIVDGDKHDDMIKVDDDLDTQLKSSPVEDCCVTEDDNVTSNCVSDEMKLLVESNIGPDNSMQNGEENLDSSSNLLNNNVDQQVYEQQSTGSKANEPGQTNNPNDIPNEIKMEEITGSNSDDVKPATASGPHELPLDTETAPNHHEMALNNITVAARGGGESSFSMADPVSGHITYLGPITSAGSISHRSDGSNTSVRSFAFPILQNEWNGSPVRMAKVDRKQSRKHRGWRQALMCCTF